MFEPKPLPDSSSFSNESLNSSDLDQRLGLYRVFLKLYEHHRELLDEILELENTEHYYQSRGAWQYIQGVIGVNGVYLTTNMVENRTQPLAHPQQTWVIGRDRTAELPIQDRRMSRRHAVVQYSAGRGFYLMDLNSTNGTYINGKPVRQPILMRDGDRIRLGSLSFVFFLCNVSPIPEELPSDLQRTNPSVATKGFVPPHLEAATSDTYWDGALTAEDSHTSMIAESDEAPDPLVSTSEQLSFEQKAEILDRFLNR